MDDGRSIAARAVRRLGALRAVVASRLAAVAGSRRTGAVAFAFAVLGGCGVPNDPNPPGSEGTNTYFTATQESSPKYLDPTSSYSANETPFTYSIYEPLLQYHYLKRPYQLIPRLATEVPQPRYYAKDGHELSADAPGEDVAESVYDIPIKRGVLYAPHPAFAKNADGSFVYRGLKAADLSGKYALTDFPKTGTRELVADDFVYAIKRMATPRIKSSAFSVMNEYIVGMTDYAKRVRVVDAQLRQGLGPTERDLPFLDFRKIPFDGATALDDHTLRIRVVGKYPQFKYWLAMTFFAPVPWEAEAFYSQPGMIEHNLSLNTWPAGTGPFMATEYVENRQHTLVRNPNYRGEPYPCEGEPGDKREGPARRLRQDDAVPRQGRVPHREGTAADEEQVAPGLSRRARHGPPRMGSRVLDRGARLRCHRAGVRAQGLPLPARRRGGQLVHRLQLARPGRRQGKDRRRRRAQPQAAAGAADRGRLGRVLRSCSSSRARPGRPRWDRCRRSSSASDPARPGSTRTPTTGRSRTATATRSASRSRSRRS